MSTIGDSRQMTTAQPFLPGPGAPGAGEAAAASLGAADIWRVIKQRKGTIILTSILAYLFVVAATVLTFLYFPSYESEAYVKLVPPTEGLSMQQDVDLPKEYVERQLATQAKQMEDPQLLIQVLSMPEVKETYFYKWYGDNFEKCLKEFGDYISVSPVKDTYLIRIAIALREPQDATLIVNMLMEKFLASSRSEFTDEGQARLTRLKDSRAAVEKELDDIRRRVAALRAQRDMPALESDRDVQVEVITMLNNTKAELTTREVDIETQLQSVRGFDPRNLPVSAEMRVVIEADPVLRYYRQQVEQLDIQLEAQKRSILGPGHRQMQALQTQRDEYFRKEAARRDELTDDLRARQLESLQQELARTRSMKITVQEQLAERENTQRDLDSAIQELKTYTQDEERLARQLEQIDMAVREADTNVQTRSKEGRLSRAQQARDAVLPSRPNFPIYLGGGAVLALLAGVGLAFLREFTDKAIRTPVDVARFGHVSVLGAVPLLDDDTADVSDVEYAVRRAPQSVTADAFRQIRAHLAFSGPRESQRVLLVTSPGPEDGKTAVAVNLAVTFAQSSETVLLIDCNFRRPGVRRIFEQGRPEGLSNILVRRGSLDSLVTKTDVPNLHILSSGPMPPNPAELLGAPAMRELLDACRSRYDRVILDGPPCLLISDGLILSTLVEGVILVARATKGTKGSLRRAKEQLTRIGARVIGAVVNGVQARAGGYFKKYYRDYYDYTDEDVVVRELTDVNERAALEMTDDADKRKS